MVQRIEPSFPYSHFSAWSFKWRRAQEDALVLAIRAENLWSIDQALARGAPIDGGVGTYGTETPLGIAAATGSMPVAKHLLERGADPNGRKQYFLDGGPLRSAAIYGFAEMVQLLIDRGARVNGPFLDGAGRTAWSSAIFGMGNASLADKARYLRVFDILEKAGATPTRQDLETVQSWRELFGGT